MDLQELAQGPQACMEAEDDRFSGSQTSQMLLYVTEELVYSGWVHKRRVWLAQW